MSARTLSKREALLLAEDEEMKQLRDEAKAMLADPVQREELRKLFFQHLKARRSMDELKAKFPSMN